MAVDNTAIPKQSIDSKLQEISNAVNKALEDVQISIEQRASAEGSTLAVSIGNEKDGFTSLTATTKKGTSAEGPSIAIMGANIKQGNVIKTVSASAKLSSVTGGTKGITAVLNETVVQASPKGLSKALTNTVGLNTSQVQIAISDASPIPSIAQASLKTELEEGGIAAKAGVNAQTAAAEVSNEIKNPFGSNNLFGGVGSSFGNILGQITALSVNAPTGYQNPQTELKSSLSTTVLNRSNIEVPTPTIVNSNGTTNLQKSVVKSKLENTNINENENVRIAGADRNWQGINSSTSRDVMPILYSDEEQRAEISQIDREIRQVIIGSLPPMDDNYVLSVIHDTHRKNMISKYTAEVVNANPNDYALPAHIWINFTGIVQMYRPFNEEVKLQHGSVPARDGAFYIYVGTAGSGGNMSTDGRDLQALTKFLNNFLVYYPGVEILGVDDVNPDTKRRPHPYFDVRDFVNASLRKPSTFDKNEIVEVPPASDLAVRRPVNIVIPKRNPNALPDVSKVVTEMNAAARSLSSTEYLKNETDALERIKQKKDNIINADLTSGNGLGGILSSKISSLSETSTSLLKSSQSFKLDQLKLGKVFDSVKGIFK